MKQVKLILVYSLVLLALLMQTNAQENRVWELDKSKEREVRRLAATDSIKRTFKKTISVSVIYGKWFYLPDSYFNSEISLFEIPEKMNYWRSSVAWGFSESISLHVKAGFQKQKNVPPKMGIIGKIIKGDDIRVEGSGVGIIPFTLGVRYNLLKNYLRPYAQANAGFIYGKSQYTIVEGNFWDGTLKRTDFKFNEFVPVFDFQVGTVYRFGKSLVSGIAFNYAVSKGFEEQLAGLSSFSGFSVDLHLGLIFNY